MTVMQVLRALVRRWYVMVAALACIAAAVYAVGQTEGVYSVRVNLVFLPPTIETADANTLRWSSESLINFAALVEREYTGNDPQPRFSSVDAPIYGSGDRSGVKVFLPNTGGQWSSDFRDAVLVVEAVDPSRDGVTELLDTAIADLQGLATSRQDAAGVNPDRRINVLVSDATSGIRYVQGSTVRAAGAITILGLGLGSAAAVLIDRAASRRASRRGASGPGASASASTSVAPAP